MSILDLQLCRGIICSSYGRYQSCGHQNLGCVTELISEETAFGNAKNYRCLGRIDCSAYQHLRVVRWDQRHCCETAKLQAEYRRPEHGTSIVKMSVSAGR
jgi:hypothetical protein